MPEVRVADENKGTKMLLAQISVTTPSSTQKVHRVSSPHLVHREQAADFRKEIIEVLFDEPHVIWNDHCPIRPKTTA